MSPMIAREDVVRRMARALRDLHDEALDSGLSRVGCYGLADIRPAEIAEHDQDALRIERRRREVFADVVVRGIALIAPRAA